MRNTTLSTLAAAPAVEEATAPTITTEQVREAHTAFQEAGIPFDVRVDDAG
ncbi:hypothetical protein [Microbacterium testaceum]|uniref:hypothetical protein n=1 Tax=Microbacterium testaceum TaxID=2033 RepID=UPI00187C9FCE|nr:hypothetical protein [Microbacterium testaceum]